MTQDNNSFSMAQVEEFEQEINRILQTHYPLDGLRDYKFRKFDKDDATNDAYIENQWVILQSKANEHIRKLVLSFLKPLDSNMIKNPYNHFELLLENEEERQFYIKTMFSKEVLDAVENGKRGYNGYYDNNLEEQFDLREIYDFLFQGINSIKEAEEIEYTKNCADTIKDDKPYTTLANFFVWHFFDLLDFDKDKYAQDVFEKNLAYCKEKFERDEDGYIKLLSLEDLDRGSYIKGEFVDNIQQMIDNIDFELQRLQEPTSKINQQYYDDIAIASNACVKSIVDIAFAASYKNYMLSKYKDTALRKQLVAEILMDTLERFDCNYREFNETILGKRILDIQKAAENGKYTEKQQTQKARKMK